jgi:hypothetical protein
MTAGAKWTWDDYYIHGSETEYRAGCEINALHHAMILYLENSVTFASEYQNAPIEVSAAGYGLDDIYAKSIGLKQDTAMDDASVVTAYVDVHADVLYYMIASWNRLGHCHVTNYGTFPRSPKNCPRHSIEGMKSETELHNGIKETLLFLLKYQCNTADGRTLGINKIFIDTGWRWEIVESVINELANKNIQPTRGIGIKAVTLPMREWKSKSSRHMGNGWFEDKPNNRTLRTLSIDTNQWKDKLAEMILANRYATETLTLFGESADHRLLAEHMTSEKPIAVEANGNRVNEWHVAEMNRDNHYFDCLVGNLAGANTLGIGRQSAEKKERHVMTIR